MASFLARQLGRRAYSAAAGEAGHHGGGMKTWKTLSFLVALPGITVCYINMARLEKEHQAHFERPEFINYEHLRIRSKRFPWGDGSHSLFHNKEVNATENGYDEE